MLVLLTLQFTCNCRLCAFDINIQEAQRLQRYCIGGHYIVQGHLR